MRTNLDCVRSALSESEGNLRLLDVEIVKKMFKWEVLKERKLKSD